MKLVFDTTKEHLKPIVKGMLKEGLHSYASGESTEDLSMSFFTDNGIDVKDVFKVVDDKAGHSNIYLGVQEALEFERERLAELCDNVDTNYIGQVESFNKVLRLTSAAIHTLLSMINSGEGDNIIVLHLETEPLTHFTDMNIVNYNYVKDNLL